MISQHSSLLTFGYLAALHCQSTHGFSLGLCAVHRQANGQDVQLKVDTSNNRTRTALHVSCYEPMQQRRQDACRLRNAPAGSCLGHAISAQVLQRPGPFNLRDFSLAMRKLHAAAASGMSDPVKTGDSGIELRIECMAWKYVPSVSARAWHSTGS
jgi:hypothetical protein